jgi:predicted DNA-binding protein (MmcQ/YjbR family)
MNIDAIREFCLSFPNSTENLQWGDDLCFKIGGKIFTIVGLESHALCLKCTPETFAELIERENIRPAPYVGRYKWVMLDQLNDVGWDELRGLIRQSYEMVSSNAPKSKALKRKAKTKSANKRPKKVSRRIRR